LAAFFGALLADAGFFVIFLADMVVLPSGYWCPSGKAA
jgi:hypothetical protein